MGILRRVFGAAEQKAAEDWNKQWEREHRNHHGYLSPIHSHDYSTRKETVDGYEFTRYTCKTTTCGHTYLG